MNEVIHQSEQESKTAAIKTLAIVGFITAIVFFVWLAVQVVRFAPSAFHNLASLAETVYGTNKQSFDIQIDTKVVNAGDPLTITLKKVRTAGTYTFSYRCTDGISAESRDQNGNIVNVPCDTKFAVPTNVDNFQVLFASEKKRFTDVPVTLSFAPEKTPDATVEKSDLVTVVNATFAEANATPATPTPVAAETPTTTKPVETPAPLPTVKPVHHTPVVSQPIITTVMPVSNPSGYTDLQTHYLGIGAFDETTKVFTPTSVFSKNTRGAIRFEVKNVGTKTSTDWTYSVTLPNAGRQVYTSPAQEPLKPNERAVILIAFGDFSKNTGNATVAVNVLGGNDTNQGNNSFNWTVQVTN